MQAANGKGQANYGSNICEESIDSFEGNQASMLAADKRKNW